MNKKEFDEVTYIDEQGYRRWKKSHDRVHRTIAFKGIYLKDRAKYPFEFKEYQVHHKDGNKENNRVENLELVHRAEHEKKHGIVRREQLQINYMTASVFWFFGILAVELISNIFKITGWYKISLFFWVSFLALGYMLYVSREKKGVKYI